MRAIQLILGILLIVLATTAERTNAQDIHFSQYRQSPMLLNASNTGNFEGDYRAGLNHRNQWSSFIKPYVTTSLFFDTFFKKGLLDNDNWGAGMVLYSDKAGTAQFGTEAVYGSLGYHYKLDPEGKQTVSIGVQGGIIQRSIKLDDLKFGNQYTSVFFNDELSSNENFTETNFIYPAVHGGVGYKMDYNEKLDFEAGFSMFNLNKPSESFFGSTDNKLSPRMSFTLGADYLYNDLLSFHPGVIFTGQTKAYEYIVGTDVGYSIKDVPLTRIIAYMGIWYRSTDALILVPGLAYNNLRVGLSYDINVSSLSAASGGRGAVELSVIYIFNTNPKLGIKRSVPCKRL